MSPGVRIVAVGTVALDAVETPGGSVVEAPGGSAPYFAAAAFRYAPVSIVGVVGSDWPDAALAPLVERGVDVDGVRRVDGTTFRWHARYDAEGTRTTVSADRGVTVRTPPSLQPAHRDPAALFLGSTDPSVQADVLEQVGTPGLVVLDSMGHWIETRRPDLLELLRRTDVLVLNDEELRALGRHADPGAAAAEILSVGLAWLVVKDGPRGARLYGAVDNREGGPLEPVATVPAQRVDPVVDPTGAGDAFAGGLVGFLVQQGGPAALNAGTLEAAMTEGARTGAAAVRSFSFDGLLGDP
ncbi:MAG: PfkB family carbohydrate kinase [Longimicrobiales bacterium]